MVTPGWDSILAAFPWIRAFRSDDLGEVRRFYGEFEGARARVAHGRQPLGCVAHSVKGADVALGSTDARVGLTARWVVQDPVLQLAMPGGSVFRTGRQATVPTGPSSVAIVPPDWEWTRCTPPGFVLALRIRRQALQAELQALRPGSTGEPQRQLLVREIDATRHDRLQSAVADVALATRPGAPAQQLALAEARLIAETVPLVPELPARREATQMSEQRVRDLEGWIDANVGEPMSLGWLCRVAGVSARCLQRAFEHRRGMSPMRFVAERRLWAAHLALLRAEPGASVTQIALDHGFDHVSRFAQLHQQVMGELPSQTLARPRQRQRAATPPAPSQALA